MRSKERELQFIMDLASAWCEDWQEPVVDVHVLLGKYGHAYNWGLGGQNPESLYLTPSEIPCVMDGADWLWESDKWKYYMGLLDSLTK